ncbi:MAG TPA: SusD/RagB family nutrient-binding outer membrane lipoprotein [Ferruginibacter sp.]|nr:SusD/RagB family nutrient-binding outer membrane lipoprotein [Ferruginibacter sp.]
MYFKTKILQALGILSICILISSCHKLEEFGDTNVNPNGSTVVNTGALLTNVLANLGTLNSSMNGGLYAQYFAESTYPGTSLYADPNFSNAAIYNGQLMDAQKIINYNTDPATKEIAAANGDNNNQIQVAKILKIYMFSYLTDRYGDIPYSEALGGVTALSPKYDKQEDIYKSMFTELAAISAALDPGGAPIKGDIAYSGNIGKWRKLANSLRILFALKLSERYPGPTEYAAVELNKAISDPGGYIATNADNFMLLYPGGNIKNPWFAQGQTLDNAVSSTFTSILAGLNDTRLGEFSNGATGVPYGLSSAASANTARVFRAPNLTATPPYVGWRSENSPFFFVTAAHVLLAVAEAYERGWVSGKTTTDAKLLYDAGVTASFEQWGLTVPAGYLSGGPADYNTGSGVASIGGTSVPGSSATTATKLERLWLQQFIAFYPDGSMAWTNWRRTEFPKLKPTVNATNSSKQIIRRYTYAPYEYNLNGAQLAIAIARLGSNSQDAHVWFDL